MYTKMFVTWLAISLMAIFMFVIGVTVFSIYYESKPSLDDIERQTTVEGLIDKINSINEARIALMNDQGEILSSSFMQDNTEPINIEYFDVRTINGRVYFLYKKALTAGSL